MPNRKLLPTALSVLTALLLASSAAHAEKADRDKPVYLEADSVKMDDIKQTSIYTGRVVITQGTLIIRGDTVTVWQDHGEFDHGTVIGRQAYFKQKRDNSDQYVEGWADRIEYNAKANTADLYIRAKFKNGEDEVHGDTIHYNADTQYYEVQGGQRDAATPGSGRVRAVIQPKDKDTKPAP